MTATFLAFSVASRAMDASQASINVTGNNIANINTEGYTRQRVDINSITISGTVQKYATPQVSTGIGSKAMGTTQIRDPYIDVRYRSQNAEDSRYKTAVSGLSDLQDVFDEASTDGLQAELSSFINDLQKFSEKPTSSDIAQVTRSAAQKVTRIINMYATQVSEVRTQQVQNLNVVVNNDFNSYVKNIADLNNQIKKEEIYGNKPNELYDKRNTLIDKLAGVATIKVSSSPEKISEDLTISRLSISIADPSTGKSIKIVDNDKFSVLSTKDDGSTVSLSLMGTDSKENNDINDYFSDGSVKGYVDLINGKGSYAAAGENNSNGVAYYQKSMDIFANQFATALNKINDVTNGTASGKPLFTNADGTTTNVTAKSIQVSKAWLENPSYISNTNSTTTTGSGGNDNILRMLAAMSDPQKFNVNPTDTTPAFTGTFNEYMTGLLGDLGTNVEMGTKFSETASSVLDTISNTRESSSGVSLNEEGINLTAYQKVYNAAMRYFNILDENLDSIINKMGV